MGAIPLLERLVSIPSVNPVLEPGGAGESEVAAFCAERLSAWGFEVALHEVAPGRVNVTAVHGQGSPTLLLNGHTDTVGVGGMEIEPFTPRIEGGRLHGRGSCDMKGGLAALMEAARRAAAEGHPGTLIVALTCDEEHASLGMQALVDSGIRADAAVVCEPTGLAVMPAHKGFAWIEATFVGRAAHGSRPDEGIDAIRHAAAFIAALDGLEARLVAGTPHPLLGHGSVHMGTIRGGSAPSVYPDRCVAVVERRTLPGEPLGSVVADFHAILAELAQREPRLDARVEVTLARGASDVPAGHRLVQGLLEACGAEGVNPSVAGMSAWVDAALLNECGIPAVCFGPGSIAQAHAADEWIEVAEVERCADVLTRVATSGCFV